MDDDADDQVFSSAQETSAFKDKAALADYLIILRGIGC